MKNNFSNKIIKNVIYNKETFSAQLFCDLKVILYVVIINIIKVIIYL